MPKRYSNTKVRICKFFPYEIISRDKAFYDAISNHPLRIESIDQTLASMLVLDSISNGMQLKQIIRISKDDIRYF